MAGFRPRCDDHESAERMGGRQARRTPGCETMLDPWLPERSERQVRAIPAVLLHELELLQEQGSRQKSAGPSIETRVDRKDGDCQRRLRLAGLRKPDDVEDMG